MKRCLLVSHRQRVVRSGRKGNYSPTSPIQSSKKSEKKENDSWVGSGRVGRNGEQNSVAGFD